MGALAKQLEEKYTAMIEQAQSDGDIQKVIELKKKMKSEISDLQKASKFLGETKTTHKEGQFYVNDTKLDLQKLIFKGDQDVLQELEKDQHFKAVVSAIEQEKMILDPNRELMKKALLLTNEMTPQLYNITEKIRQVLQLTKRIELYVYQETSYYGVCRPADENTLSVILSSGLIENFETKELSFIIGKYIGHHLLGHNEFSVHQVLAKGHDLLSPFHAIKLFTWHRNAQISADRFGLICADSIETVMKTFFKLSSGLSMSSVHFDISNYVAKFRDLKIELDDESISTQSLHSAHPFAPIRIRALEYFYQSKLYGEISGKNRGIMVREKVEAKILETLQIVDPSYLGKNDEHNMNIQEFILIGGFMMALSNGSVDKEEVDALRSLSNEQTFVKVIKSVNGKNMQQLMEILKTKIETLKMYLNQNTKMKIIKNMALIIIADGVIDEAEVLVLYKICDLLNVKRNFADQILHEVAST